MPLTHVDLEKQLSPIRWFLPDLLLSGYLNFVASLPGHGKTAMLSALAWQATRPDGGTFLDRRVAPGATLYVDYDAPGEGRSIRYWLAQHKNAYPSGDMNPTGTRSECAKGSWNR